MLLSFAGEHKHLSAVSIHGFRPDDVITPTAKPPSGRIYAMFTRADANVSAWVNSFDPGTFSPERCYLREAHPSGGSGGAVPSRRRGLSGTLIGALYAEVYRTVGARS
jgi:hypothetical protein